MAPSIDKQSNTQITAIQSARPTPGAKILTTREGNTRYGILSKPAEIGGKIIVYPGMNPRGLAGAGELSVSIYCLLDLHRFAMVYGSSSESPVEYVGNVYYGDEFPYIQCGRTYEGYITILCVLSGAVLPVVAIEPRICRRDPNRIVIETYGEIAAAVPIGIWFNKGAADAPDWTKLNSVETSATMAYESVSFTFVESNVDGATTIDCCTECFGCGCIICDNSVTPLGIWTDTGGAPISVNFNTPTIYNYGLTSKGRFTFYGIMTSAQSGSNICSQIEYWVEFKYDCNKLMFWTYAKFTGKNPQGTGNSRLVLTYVRNGYSRTLIDTTTPDTPFDVHTTTVHYVEMPFEYFATCIGTMKGVMNGLQSYSYLYPYITRYGSGYTDFPKTTTFFAQYPELLLTGLIDGEIIGNNMSDGSVKSSVPQQWNGSAWAAVWPPLNRALEYPWQVGITMFNEYSVLTPTNQSKLLEFNRAYSCIKGKKVQFKEVGYEADVVDVVDTYYNNTSRYPVIVVNNVTYVGGGSADAIYSDRTVSVLKSSFTITGGTYAYVDEVAYCGPFLGGDAYLTFEFTATITGASLKTASKHLKILTGYPTTSSKHPWVGAGHSYMFYVPQSASGSVVITGTMGIHDDYYSSYILASATKITARVLIEFPYNSGLTCVLNASNVRFQTRNGEPYDPNACVPGGWYRHTIVCYTMGDLLAFTCNASCGCTITPVIEVSSVADALVARCPPGTTITLTNATHTITGEIESISAAGVIKLLKTSITGASAFEMIRHVGEDLPYVYAAAAPMRIAENIHIYSGTGYIFKEPVYMSCAIYVQIYMQTFVDGVWTDWVPYDGSINPSEGYLSLQYGGVYAYPTSFSTYVTTYTNTATTISTMGIDNRQYYNHAIILDTQYGVYVRKYKLVVPFVGMTLKYCDNSAFDTGQYSMGTSGTYTMNLPEN